MNRMIVALLLLNLAATVFFGLWSPATAETAERAEVVEGAHPQVEGDAPSIEGDWGISDRNELLTFTFLKDGQFVLTSNRGGEALTGTYQKDGTGWSLTMTMPGREEPTTTRADLLGHDLLKLTGIFGAKDSTVVARRK